METFAPVRSAYRQDAGKEEESKLAAGVREFNRNEPQSTQRKRRKVR
ncbi:hypothetical protein NIES4074_28940 [Cylindrospermum sp. NIES-4074]|nr:hypothetical protein NIES4074_28940 [Cylindrospermum sp. NIES-4074]